LVRGALKPAASGGRPSASGERRAAGGGRRAAGGGRRAAGGGRRAAGGGRRAAGGHDGGRDFSISANLADFCTFYVLFDSEMMRRRPDCPPRLAGRGAWLARAAPRGK
jgi:hypothetical protein